VAHPTGAAGADGAGRAETSIQRGTVRPTEGAFRRALLGSAVCNTPDTHRLAAKVERAGGWPILLAVDAAKRAGQDWRPAVAEARRRLADDADRLRGRHGPPCGPSLRLAPVADLVRTPGLGGDPLWAVSGRRGGSCCPTRGARARARSGTAHPRATRQAAGKCDCPE
jgi:hypothetical protein